MSYWAIVQCEPQREHLARMGIMRLRFESYMPRIRVRSRIVPLFPSYLFCRIDEQFYPVLWTQGVRQILMADTKPARLPDEVVADLKRRHDRDGLVRLPKAPTVPGKAQGSGVRVTRGPFAGSLGVYQGMSAHERERILLSVLGRQVTVELPAKDSEPLDIVASKGDTR
jgi:transcription antitermination factor NusG